MRDWIKPPVFEGAGKFLCCSCSLALSRPKVQQERSGAPQSLEPWVIPGSKQSHGIWFDLSSKHWHPKEPRDAGRWQCCPPGRSLHLGWGKGRWKESNINSEGWAWHTELAHQDPWTDGSSLGTRVAGLETGPKQPPKPAREQRVTPVPSLCTLAHTKGSSGGSEGLTPPALSFSLLSLEPLALALIGCWCSGRGPNTCHPHFSTARRCLELSPMGQTPPAPKSQRPGCRRAPNQRRN